MNNSTGAAQLPAFVNYPWWWAGVGTGGGAAPAGPENGVIDNLNNQIVDSSGNNIIHA